MVIGTIMRLCGVETAVCRRSKMQNLKANVMYLVSKNSRAVMGLAGLALGSLTALSVPIVHDAAFLLTLNVFGFEPKGIWKYGIWSYEFWSTALGLVVASVLLLKHKMQSAVVFGCVFALSLSAILYGRAADAQSLLGIFLRPLNMIVIGTSIKNGRK